MRPLALLVSFLAACTGGPAGSSDTCTAADALDAGVVTATLNDAAWESTATFVWQGESLAITANPADGWRLNVTSRTTADGTTILDAVNAGAFPVEVDLSEGGGGFALVYPTDGDSYNTDAAGGTVTLSALDDANLYACFSFDAATGGGEEVTVADGAVHAELFEM